jgi:hypothetical protein
MKKQQTTKTSSAQLKPERIKFDGDWEDAVDIALKAKRSATGWPK